VIKKGIPNLFTIGNLFFGISSVIFASNGETKLAMIMIVLSIIMDGIDGRLARMLRVDGEFGKELDSLSDVVSFGLAPAFMMYVSVFEDMNTLGYLATTIFPICGALRLARFNIVESPPGYFIGLPIPAAGGLVSLLALFHEGINNYLLVGAIFVLSLLMVSRIQYPSFKKIGMPKWLFVVFLILLVTAVFLYQLYPNIVTKLLFVPLVFYTLYGIKKR
jgi:CDP-diacylglycerol--serine O-phosphatidyltransferase